MGLFGLSLNTDRQKGREQMGLSGLRLIQIGRTDMETDGTVWAQAENR
jgi:hypothetical protein